MTDRIFRNAKAPCVVFLNGIGDHLLALPALRALAHLYPRRLKIVAHRAIAGLFLGHLPSERLIGVQTYTFGDSADHHFDVEAAVKKIGGTDMFISLSTGHSKSMRDLRRQLAPRLSVGFFDDFDVVGHRPRGTHSADWYFNLVRLLDGRLRFSDFTAPPPLSRSAVSAARKITKQLGARSKRLVIHNETTAEKMWPWERFTVLMREFLSAHPEYGVIVVGTNTNGIGHLAADSAPIIAPTGLRLATAVAVVSEADLFCGIDSSMLHVADFFGIPGVGLFGPTSPAEFGFRLAPHHHLRARQAMDVTVRDARDALERIRLIVKDRPRPAKSNGRGVAPLN